MEKKKRKTRGQVLAETPSRQVQPTTIEMPPKPRDKTPRDSMGRILPGHSLNAGRAAATAREIRELARAYAPELIHRLFEVAMKSDNDQAVIVAADKVLDRAIGKPTEQERDEQQTTKPRQINGELLLRLLDATNPKQ